MQSPHITPPPSTTGGRLWGASVKITCNKAGGSGTVIWAESGKGIVLSCAHLWPKDATQGAKADVHFPPKDGRPAKTAPGELIGVSSRADLSALFIDTDDKTDWAPLSTERATAVGEKVYQYGYPGGWTEKFPHMRAGTYVTVKDKTHLYFSFGPRPGDSGSGVFRHDGVLIGVVSTVENWGAGDRCGAVSTHEIGVFVNEVCLPFFKKRCPGSGGPYGRKPEPIPEKPPGRLPGPGPAPMPDDPGVSPTPSPIPGHGGIGGPPGPPGAPGRDGKDGKDAPDNRAEIEALRQQVKDLEAKFSGLSGSFRIRIEAKPK